MGVSVKELTNAMASSLADAIERSDGTWTKPYSATGPRMPHNPVTGRSYSGMNWFVLAAAANGRSIDHGGWATYRQWQKAECQVRKGEYSVRVIRVAVAKCCGEKACNEGSRCGVTPRKWVKVYPVFSATQVDGDVPVAAGYERDAPEWDHSAVTELFGGSRARWQIQDGIVPHYDLKTDIITVPPPEAFHSVGAWASTLAHEHAHWTGPRTGRLKDRVGSDEARAREELVAELAAVVICSALGVEHEPVEHHADYLRSWASHLRGEDGGAALAAGLRRRRPRRVGHRGSDHQRDTGTGSSSEGPARTGGGRHRRPRSGPGGRRTTRSGSGRPVDAVTVGLRPWRGI